MSEQNNENILDKLPEILEKAPTFHTFKTEYEKLGEILGISQNGVQRLRDDLVNGYKTYGDAVFSLVEQWRVINDDTVTVFDFCAKLEEHADWSDICAHVVTVATAHTQLHATSSLSESQVPDEKVVGKISYYTNIILGKGREQTVVYQGKFQGRKVAVKKILCGTAEDKAYLTEINILSECDVHKNVVRYFAMEMITGDTLQIFLALEYCDITLAQWIRGAPDTLETYAVKAIKILKQVTKGLEHLHQKNFIHRDIKPENVLLQKISKHKVVAKISDFGISRRVPQDRTKVTLVTHSGTEGWKAPEIIGREVSKENEKHYQSVKTDIFALGCLFYYVLTGGSHPFGQNTVTMPYNILKSRPKVDVDSLMRGPGGVSSAGALRLIFMMIAKEPERRPQAAAILNHHVFWTLEKATNFLVDVSKSLEKVEEGSVLDKCIREAEYDPLLEPYCQPEDSDGWFRFVSESIRDYIDKQKDSKQKENKQREKVRRYDRYLVQDLVRLIRNMECHLTTQSENVQKSLCGQNRGKKFLEYWLERFPFLVDTLWMRFERMKEDSSSVLSKYYGDNCSFANFDISERRLTILESFVVAQVQSIYEATGKP